MPDTVHREDVPPPSNCGRDDCVFLITPNSIKTSNSLMEAKQRKFDKAGAEIIDDAPIVESYDLVNCSSCHRQWNRATFEDGRVEFEELNRRPPPPPPSRYIEQGVKGSWLWPIFTIIALGIVAFVANAIWK